MSSFSDMVNNLPYISSDVLVMSNQKNVYTRFMKKYVALSFHNWVIINKNAD